MDPHSLGPWIEAVLKHSDFSWLAIHPTGDSQRRLLKAYETEKLDLNSVECKISMSKGIVIFVLSVET